MSRFIPFVFAVVALAAAGCTARVHYPREASDVARLLPVTEQVEADFAYGRKAAFALDRQEGRTRNFRVQALGMRSVGENGQKDNLVTARYFESTLPGPKPLVIVLPIWGVHTLPSDAFTRHVTREGNGTVNVLQLHGWYRLFDMERLVLAATPGEFESLMGRMAQRVVNTVIDIRRILDWAESRPEIDRHRVALVGFSLSAMVASIALSNEPRIGAGVLVMGSASPHEAFATCGGAARKLRETVTARFHWSHEKYRSSLKTVLTRIDPARFPGRVDPRRVLIVEAGKDTCLPAGARQRLWEVMGRPARIVYQYDHRTSFFAMTFLGGGILQKEAFQFLRKVFGLPEDEEPPAATTVSR